MNRTPKQCWSDCLDLIRENVTQQQYKTWFAPIGFESFDDKEGVLLLQIPSNFVYEYLEENYVELIRKVLYRCFGRQVQLRYRIVVDKTNHITQQVEAEELSTAVEVKGKQRGNKAPSLLDVAQPQQIDSQLDPRRTFANYIEGDSNRLSRSVGLSIAEHPQKTTFNPLFIYGPSGCGKTHLINAIGVRTKELYPDMRVLYVSARLFQVQYTDAVLQNSTNDFISFYQTIDMLIVDDVQEWMTAVKTQDTFFHIFNHLFKNGKRIILASDRPPVDLKGMNDRLLTRFSCGLIAELEKPNVQLCKDILRSKIRRDGLSIPDDVVDYISHTANGSIRDLEGVINSLLAYSIYYNSNIDMRLAERIIKRAVKLNNQPLTVEDILNKVCTHYNVSVANVNSRSRKRDFVVARQVAMYLAQKFTKMPAARIGKLVGGRDHSTVIHSCDTVAQRLKIDKAFSEELTSIENSFRLKKQE